jgi:hypothetical protein
MNTIGFISQVMKLQSTSRSRSLHVMHAHRQHCEIRENYIYYLHLSTHEMGRQGSSHNRSSTSRSTDAKRLLEEEHRHASNAGRICVGCLCKVKRTEHEIFVEQKCERGESDKGGCQQRGRR